MKNIQKILYLLILALTFASCNHKVITESVEKEENINIIIDKEKDVKEKDVKKN